MNRIALPILMVVGAFSATLSTTVFAARDLIIESDSALEQEKRDLEEYKKDPAECILTSQEACRSYRWYRWTHDQSKQWGSSCDIEKDGWGTNSRSCRCYKTGIQYVVGVVNEYGVEVNGVVTDNSFVKTRTFRSHFFAKRYMDGLINDRLCK